MMCPHISELEFSEHEKLAIKEIRTIKTISGLQAISSKTSKERQFWKAVYNGCVAVK